MFSSSFYVQLTLVEVRISGCSEAVAVASHRVGRLARTPPRARFENRLETFIQRDRLASSCYRAANWRRVGQIQGRSRQNRPDGRPYRLPIKDVYLYPLHPRFAQRLQGATALNPIP